MTPNPPKPFTKPALPVDLQLQRFIDRGIVVSDHNAARATLARISYYRFSAYALPWRTASNGDAYQPGTTFDQVMAHYEFDRELRNLIWQAIEPIEVTFRTRLTQYLAETRGAFGHTDPATFVSDRGNWRHGDWLRRIEEEAERARHEQFIQHYQATYQGFPSLPIWMATEVMSFGNLSRAYRNLPMRDRRVLARSIGLHEGYVQSWLHALNEVRNVCAHHGRLWNRIMGISPERPQRETGWDRSTLPADDRVGCMLLMLSRLLGACDIPYRSTWRKRIQAHLAPMLPRWQQAMGLPHDWTSHPAWTETP